MEPLIAGTAPADGYSPGPLSIAGDGEPGFLPLGHGLGELGHNPGYRHVRDDRSSSATPCSWLPAAGGGCRAVLEVVSALDGRELLYRASCGAAKVMAFEANAFPELTGDAVIVAPVVEYALVDHIKVIRVRPIVILT